MFGLESSIQLDMFTFCIAFSFKKVMSSWDQKDVKG